MSTISRDEVAHLAKLARLAVTEQELATFAGQLDEILESVAKVAEAAGPEVPQMAHVEALANVLRSDEVRPGLSQQQALAGAPAAEAGRFAVPRILGENPREGELPEASDAGQDSTGGGSPAGEPQGEVRSWS